VGGDGLLLFEEPLGGGEVRRSTRASRAEAEVGRARGEGEGAAQGALGSASWPARELSLPSAIQVSASPGLATVAARASTSAAGRSCMSSRTWARMLRAVALPRSISSARARAARLSANRPLSASTRAKAKCARRLLGLLADQQLGRPQRLLGAA